MGTRVIGKEFRDYLFTWEWQAEYNSLEPEQLNLQFDQDGIVRLGEVSKEDGWIVYSLYPEHPGSVMLTVSDRQTNQELMTTLYRVSFLGIITDYTTGNFTNYRMYHFTYGCDI